MYYCTEVYYNGLRKFFTADPLNLKQIIDHSLLYSCTTCTLAHNVNNHPRKILPKFSKFIKFC